ncbi:hypothetical protein CAOG_01448 [Capsaspora owczarzaki ATCC 30864]|uniref:Mis18 domain-containing protein n=1 Tax=Capsaspora owczarzaki (strain ATCC 30864) TaxID=595528 RepID=A0A0D2WKG6_CAPO3|nr:hypothetical protein CAOG_01448 [Capsaspora owczarzaki ATCC 30864]KJE90073.1 hypothetical protein CAOG_001448 [Capsaspora owczarzaki ATCC 30864]|eukprot:XP_004364316.1 hypothetical protein CAOG_01448 [Capsaspora owczarzaki ATCC 30864]
MSSSSRSAGQQAEHAAADEAANEEEPIAVVFQCSECRSILGDSCAYVTPVDDLNAITLAAVSPAVLIAKELQTSVSGVDTGCGYYTLTCAGCNASIGRMYCSTPRQFDIIRDHYTFHIDCLTSYTIGKPSKTPQESMLLGSASISDYISRLRDIVTTIHERVERLEGMVSTDRAPDRGRKV